MQKTKSDSPRINPANILFTKEGQIKLADFGVGHSLDSILQQASSFTGTLSYMAPEVIQEEPSYSFPADVWSLGCVIYQLMALKLPFIGRNICDLLQKIKKGEYPPLEGNYRQELKQLVSKMLIVDASKRISIEEICKISGAELNSLGLKYKKGDGIEINLQEAQKYFKMSADLGDPEGMYNYGVSLAKG
jgi:serine/threonine protein kinase